jgi:hypothetical protein
MAICIALIVSKNRVVHSISTKRAIPELLPTPPPGILRPTATWNRLS